MQWCFLKVAEVLVPNSFWKSPNLDFKQVTKDVYTGVWLENIVFRLFPVLYRILVYPLKAARANVPLHVQVLTIVGYAVVFIGFALIVSTFGLVGRIQKLIADIKAWMKNTVFPYFNIYIVCTSFVLIIFNKMCSSRKLVSNNDFIFMAVVLTVYPFMGELIAPDKKKNGKVLQQIWKLIQTGPFYFEYQAFFTHLTTLKGLWQCGQAFYNVCVFVLSLEIISSMPDYDTIGLQAVAKYHPIGWMCALKLWWTFLGLWPVLGTGTTTSGWWRLVIQDILGNKIEREQGDFNLGADAADFDKELEIVKERIKWYPKDEEVPEKAQK